MPEVLENPDSAPEKRIGEGNADHAFALGKDSRS